MSDELWFALDDPAELVIELGRELYAKQGAARMNLAQDSLALYLGSSRHSITGSDNPLAMLDLIGQESSGYNLIQAITDTKINATLKNKVRPMYITESADSETKRKASAMQAACDGIMYETGMQGALRRATCKAGFIFEGGGVEWYADTANSRVVASPVWCWEFFVSKKEARLGNPRQMFARHAIDRAVLLSYLADAPKSVRDAVRDAKAATGRDIAEDARDPKRISDMVIVYKAWHLPSGRVDMNDPRSFGKTEEGRKGKPNHDGRHVVAIDGGLDGEKVCLVDMPWPYDHFPVAWFKPNTVLGSYWSRGEPEVLASSQIESNKWNQREARIIDLHAVPQTFISKESGLNPATMTNAIANIHQVKGSPSAAVFRPVQPAVPPDLNQRIQQIAQNARDQRGMSEMSMTARKPPGINHEPGLAYLADTESERHTEEFEGWEDFNLDCQRNIIRCLRELAELDPGFEVMFHSNKHLRRMKWRDIDLGDSFSMKLWPTNWLKEDPAQRADQIADFVDRGILPPEAMIDAVDDPDLAALLGNRIAMQRNVEHMLDRICEDGLTENEYPNPYVDLQLAKRMGIQRYNELAAEQEDWRTVNDVIKWLELVDQMIGVATPPTSPQQGQGDTLGAVGPGAAAPPPLPPGGGMASPAPPGPMS